MAGYAMAAALVDYREPGFVSFMSDMRTRYIGNHGRWVNLTQTSEDTANNWGAWAMSSRIALDAYVGDRTDLARAAKVFRGFLGDRSAYAGFTHTGEFDSTWVCGSAASWVPINPAGCGYKSGAVVEDISRSGGSYPTVDDTGRTYWWETIGGAMLSAQVLATHGYPDVFSWSDKALLRAAQFEQSHGGYQAALHDQPVHPLERQPAYGVNLGPISSTAGFGRQFGFTDWLS